MNKILWQLFFAHELESAIGKPTANDSTKINDENYQQELKEYIKTLKNTR
ncbi:MAG: hypothetical protein IPL95_05810 [Saprospiraceae bacterium]|nr:hypothetical protein [Saprospiraceae bacterium]